MPREDRRIIFDYNETYKALYTLTSKRDVQRIKAGYISHAREDDADTKYVIFTIENNQTQQKDDASYSRDFVAAALMLACRSEGIPISKKANKSIILDPDNEEVILRAQIRR